ncbi:hypothetical protein [uncultured Fibrella sp.]|uniref:hypothetical protein n=1 Tax=uncultured Fibrella sp. TaxID=1284596 RepID=UPI0035CBC7C5
MGTFFGIVLLGIILTGCSEKANNLILAGGQRARGAMLFGELQRVPSDGELFERVQRNAYHTVPVVIFHSDSIPYDEIAVTATLAKYKLLYPIDTATWRSDWRKTHESVQQLFASTQSDPCRDYYRQIGASVMLIGTGLLVNADAPVSLKEEYIDIVLTQSRNAGLAFYALKNTKGNWTRPDWQQKIDTFRLNCRQSVTQTAQKLDELKAEFESRRDRMTPQDIAYQDAVVSFVAARQAESVFYTARLNELVAKQRGK